MAEGAIDSLSIEIGASSTKAIEDIGKMVGSMKELKSEIKGLGNLSFGKKLGESMSALAGSMKAVKSEDISKLRQVASAMKTFEGVKEISINSKFAQNMADIAAAVDLLKPEHINGLTKFGNAIKNLEGVKTTGYDKLPPALLNIAGAVDNITDDTITRIHRLTMALGRLKGVDLRGVGSVMGEQRKTVTAEMKAAQKSGTQSTKSNRIKGFIPTYDDASDLRSNLKQIGKELKGNIKSGAQAFGNFLKEAARHAQNIAKSILSFAGKQIKGIWDKSAFGSLEKSLGRIKNVINSFSRIAFYRAIRSAIKYVTDSLKEGVENAYHYSKEFGDATGYIAEAYDRIASSEFKMSNQLGAAWATMIAYIEPIIIKIINLVTRAADAVTQFFAIMSGKGTYLKAVDYNKDWAESATGAAEAAKEWKNQLLGFDEINRLEEPSDGSGGSGGKAGLNYGDMFEETAKNAFFEELRDAFENGQWALMGQLLGKKFNEIVDMVDWKKYGKKLGRGLQASITVAYNFLKTADFRHLGERVSEFINNALYQVNFDQAGRTWMRLRLALLDFLLGIADGLNWRMMAIKLSNFITGSLDELATWLKGKDPVKVANALKDFFGNIKYKEIGDKVKEVLKNALGLLSGVVDELLPEGLGDDVKDGISDAIKKADFAAIHNVLAYKLDKAVFGEGWADFFWKFGDYAGKDLVLGMMDGVDEQGRSSKYKNRASEFIVGVLGLPSDEQWKQWGLDAIGWLAGGFVDIKTELDTVVGEPIRKLVNEDIPETVAFFKELGPKAVDWIREGFADFNTDLDAIFVQPFRDMWDGLKKWWDGLSLGAFHIPRPVFEWTYTEATGALARAMQFVGLPTSIPHLNISWYAQGGFPEDGLFMANHGELVGQFSNGRTAVANNEQITAGIARAVYDAFMTAFSQTGGSNSDNDRPVNIYLDSKLIAQSTTKYQAQYARAMGA